MERRLDSDCREYFKIAGHIQGEDHAALVVLRASQSADFRHWWLGRCGHRSRRHRVQVSDFYYLKFKGGNGICVIFHPPHALFLYYHKGFQSIFIPIFSLPSSRFIADKAEDKAEKVDKHRFLVQAKTITNEQFLKLSSLSSAERNDEVNFPPLYCCASYR